MLREDPWVGSILFFFLIFASQVGSAQNFFSTITVRFGSRFPDPARPDARELTRSVKNPENHLHIPHVHIDPNYVPYHTKKTTTPETIFRSTFSRNPGEEGGGIRYTTEIVVSERYYRRNRSMEILLSKCFQGCHRRNLSIVASRDVCMFSVVKRLAACDSRQRGWGASNSACSRNKTNGNTHTHTPHDEQ